MTQAESSAEPRCVFVTGGASGIGLAIVERFLESGDHVVVFDRNAEALETAERRLGSPERITAVLGDASVEEDVRRAVERTVEKHTRLDVLVNNAGIERSGTVVAMSSETWDEVFANNVRSMFLFAKYAIPHMPRGGAIVNIASIDAVAAYPEYAAYDSSKAAVLALTRGLAVDHGPAGIRVNAVCPGYIETPLLEEYIRKQKDPEAARKEIAALHPLGRAGRPEDVTEAAWSSVRPPPRSSPGRILSSTAA